MRIAFFLHRFPSLSETFVLRQITGLLDLGHDIEIFSERRPPEDVELNPPEMAEYDLAERTTYLDTEMPPESGVWSLPVWPITGETWLPGAEQPIANRARIQHALPTILRCLDVAPELAIQTIDADQYGEQALSLEALYHLGSLLQRAGDYDLIHAHFGPVANNLRFARALWHVPMIATFHGYDYSMIPRTLGRGVYRRLFEEVDAVTTISEYARTQLVKLGCPAEKLHLTRMGLRLEDFPLSPRALNQGETVRILSVGRLVEKKGLEFALRAVALVSQQNKNLSYDIVGDGPLSPKLQQLIHDLNLESIVTLWGAQENSFVRQQMAKAHLFVLPSVTAGDGDQEGIPVSLMEAQASGLPVLSTRHSGIPELVIDGESGILVPEKDTQALTAGLLRLIGHPQDWARMGRAGRKIVEENYNIASLVPDLMKLYQATVSAFRKAQPHEALSAS
jgi:colanic acid/amylovoran/stewartan biosynthesis glycosyltransferase WcaL/AmsK/CpsK